MAGGLVSAKYRKPKDPHQGGVQMPLIVPDSTWEVPTSLPDLRSQPIIAIDTEGKDVGLTQGRGSSWPFAQGIICGVSIAWPGGALYAPTAHPDTECIDEQNVIRWVEDHKRAGCRFVTHHGSHDWGWMRTKWGIECPDGQIDDTEGMAAIVDENRLSYTLDDLCRWRGIPGKDESKLREAAAAFGYSDVKAHMADLPARYVGPYAEQDATATLGLRDSLWEEILAQGTGDAYQLEMDVLPMVLEMRRRGIRVDTDAACRAEKKLLAQRDDVMADLAHRMGRSAGNLSMEMLRSNRSLVQMFEAEGLERVLAQHRDHKGNVSFEAAWMRKHDHWLPSLTAKATQLHDAAHKFIAGYVLGYAHRGRLHGSINQYRGEEGGTRSHRFSYSDPPLQQMPAREEELAALIRGAFLPEPGEVWGAADYSQQEYRLIVHFAALLGCRKADEAVDLYVNNPATDFHILVSEWTGLDRKPAKDTNFAKAFGAGIPKFAAMIGKSPSEAKAIYEQYDHELPFVKELGKQCQVVAEKRGYIRLLDGARSHFDMWEPSWRSDDEAYAGPRPLAQAREVWGDRRKLKRAFGHKAMNRLIQGSAARQTKVAMRNCWRAGHVPLIQMHDELGFSISNLGVAQEVQAIMRDAVTLTVPMKVDCELGASWGEASAKVERVSPEEFQVMQKRSSGETRVTLDGREYVH